MPEMQTANGLLEKNSDVMKTTKGGRAGIGIKAKAKKGKYVHLRKAAPKKGARYITKKTKSGKLLRIMYSGKKGKLQSVLTPIKKRKKRK